MYKNLKSRCKRLQSCAPLVFNVYETTKLWLRILQALQGFGVDRHLLGLKLTAIENGIEIPKLYTDAGFKKSAHMRISTSQVSKGTLFSDILRQLKLPSKVKLKKNI